MSAIQVKTQRSIEDALSETTLAEVVRDLQKRIKKK
jgi:hypothetical protein